MTPTIEAPPYQPLEGCDIPALQPCIERWEMMRPLLPTKPGRMIDFGCHTGWFCRKFSKEGWRVWGLDRSVDWIETAKSLNQHAGKIPPSYYAFDFIESIFPQCDVALCLSLAMYLFDDDKKGWSFFQSVSESSKIMFLDFGGQYAKRLPFDESTVIEQMVSQTHFTAGRLLGRTNFESRPFYIFER